MRPSTQNRNLKLSIEDFSDEAKVYFKIKLTKEYNQRHLRITLLRKGIRVKLKTLISLCISS